MRWIVTSFVACAVASLAACSRSNNLLEGRVEATVGGHTVVVTDCYRTDAPQPHTETSADGKTAYHYTPCHDADVVIRDEELTVNGKPYGRLDHGDAVTVDHGKVLVNDQPRSS